MSARATPNDAMRLVLGRVRGHGREHKQVDNGPHWITGCPTEGHIAHLVRWDQHTNGKVSVHPCVKGCTPAEILAGLTLDDDRIRAYSPNGSDPFTKPGRPRTGGTPPGDGLAIYEKLKAALDDGYDDGRGRTGRYQCPACGVRGDGHGLKVDYDPNRSRRILLLCFQGCPVEEILEPLDMTLAELCADDDTDELGEEEVSSPTGEETVEFSDAHLAAKAVADFLQGTYLWALGLGWLRWDDTRWKRTPEPEIREKLRRWAVRNYEAAGKEVAKALRAGDKKTAEQLARIEQAWFGVCSRSKLNAIADLARGIVLTDTALFDAHPDLLNCPNGVIDLRTGEISAHDPSLLLTKIAGCDLDLFATSPDWDKTLSALPKDVADWMQVRLGQAATGYPPDDDVVPVGQGAGKNGKSTLFTGIARALGEYYTLVSDRVILANPGDHPTELMELRGARFALIEETPEERKLDIQRLKKITGTTEITARLVHQDSVTFTTTHSLFVTSNHRPVITQTDYGTWRRLALVRFPRTFNGDGADPNLRDRVKQDPGIHRAVLAWIVAGARRWYASNQVTPAAPEQVVRDTEDWRAGSDLILGYWRDRLIPEFNVHVMATELYADFTDWLRSHGQGEWAERTFTERFRDHQETERHHVRHDRIRRSAGLRHRNMVISTSSAPERYKAWIGLRFTQASDQQEDEPGQGGKGATVSSDSRTGTSNHLSDPSHPAHPEQEPFPEEDISGTAEILCPICGKPLGESYIRLGRTTHPACRATSGGDR
jgi:putative DNA primase/helicase